MTTAPPVPTAQDVPGPEPAILVLDRTSAEDRAVEHLRVITAALDDAGIDYWYVPSSAAPGRTRLATQATSAEVLLAALPALDEYWSAVSWDLRTREWVPADPADPALSDVLAFHTTVKDPWGRRRIGMSAAVEVETWREAGTDLLAPRNHARGRSIPTSDPWTPPLRIRGATLRSRQCLLAPAPTDLVDPVDAVITWVDSADPQYLARRSQWLDTPDQPDLLSSGAARTRSLDELRFMLRSLDMYAPWLRHIFLVTDGQVPPWLDQGRDDLTVVDHADIITGALPTFNSHAIEACLHHIPELSEHYVYFNDDTMLATRTVAEDFFDGSGRILFQPSGEYLGVGPAAEGEAAPGWAGRNVRALLERDFGRTITHKLRHVPHPQRRSIARELERRYADDWAATTSHRWRDRTDIAPVQLHVWYAMLTNRASATRVDYRYVELSDVTSPTELIRIGSALKRVSMFCVNMRTEPQLPWPEVAAATEALLVKLFPFQSRFELAGDASAPTDRAAPGSVDAPADASLRPPGDA